MALKVRSVLPLTLAVGALLILMLIVAGAANAGHVRPEAASPIRVPLVPAYNVCNVGSATMTHGTPLSAPSCAPTQSSTAITLGTPDANGAPASGTGFVKLIVLQGGVAPNQSDVAIISEGTDIRCRAGTAACGSTNQPGTGADYIGEVQGNATIRITDHFNGSPGPGGTSPGTVIDLPFPVEANCAATASATIGGTCSANTTANAVVPGAVKVGKRAIVEITQLTVNDGGPDGVVGTTPNTVFAKQGIFIP